MEGFRADDVMADDVALTVLFPTCIFLAFMLKVGRGAGDRVDSGAALLVVVRCGLFVAAIGIAFDAKGRRTFLGVRGKRDGGVTCGRSTSDTDVVTASVDEDATGARWRGTVDLYEQDMGGGISYMWQKRSWRKVP